MSAATPTKRRPLGAIDANVAIPSRSPCSSSSASLLSAKLLATAAQQAVAFGSSPLKKATVGEALRDATPLSPPRSRSLCSPTKKRTLDEAEVIGDDGETEEQPAPKKLCSEQSVLAGSSTPPFVEEASEQVVLETMKPSVEAADEDEPPASQPTCPSAPRSISPDSSSVFDTSALNTTQFTAITEPDTDALGAVLAPVAAPTPTATTTAATAVSTVAAAASIAHAPALHSSLLDTIPILPPLQPRRIPTRDELRQKAEILKLRLSLATYKIRTNQTDIPLDKLQVRPVPGMNRRRTPLPSMSAHTVERATPAQYWYRSSGASQSGASTPIKSQLLSTDSPQANAVDHMSGSSTTAAAARENSDEWRIADKSQRSVSVLPGLEYLSTSTLPQRRMMDVIEEEETVASSALTGGAAKGLLSLSQGSH